MYVYVIASNLKYLRERRGWSHEDLARETKEFNEKPIRGVNVLTIRLIERVEFTKRCQLGVAEALARTLGVKLEDLTCPIISKPYDVGGGVIMDLSDYPSPEALRASGELMISLFERRRILLEKAERDGQEQPKA